MTPSDLDRCDTCGAPVEPCDARCDECAEDFSATPYPPWAPETMPADDEDVIPFP